MSYKPLSSGPFWTIGECHRTSSHAIEQLHLEPFYGAYRSAGHGRAAHEPKMMLTLLAYSHCIGERNSRGIERHCRENATLRAICADQAPDHTTIAGFRVRHQEALADLFGQVPGRRRSGEVSVLMPVQAADVAAKFADRAGAEAGTASG
ncbi:transposase [Streptomyces sp. NPDC048550]|uniref:transposase n=1 Tax=Streptomyces sp. NPDC048550 TaxID=3155739 RepID=UPI003423F5DD